jgi:hypothetical protein
MIPVIDVKHDPLKIIYYWTCPICGKIIAGWSEAVVKVKASTHLIKHQLGKWFIGDV